MDNCLFIYIIYFLMICSHYCKDESEQSHFISLCFVLLKYFRLTEKRREWYTKYPCVRDPA